VARRVRRRRIRVRGGSLSLALVAVAIGVLGAGAAIGQQASASGTAGLLTKGASGPAVKTVQRALGVSATGVFGHHTAAVVKQFQRNHGLIVDGIVGPQTRNALGLASASRSAAGSAATGSATAGSSATGSATTGSSSTGQAPAASGSLQSIARCESGGDPHAIGGGGQFRGKYQFTRQTWQSVGGSGDPAAAPVAEQDRRAAMLYQQSGASNWPVCGR